jgi:hypothetical protein
MASFNAIALLATNKPATSKAAGDVRCSTLCGLKSDVTLSPRSATTGLMRRSTGTLLQSPLSALATNIGGTFRPSALATLKLITSPN